MTYEEWRKRLGPHESTDKLLRRAYQLLQEWKTITVDELEEIICQMNGADIVIILPGETQNFVNWGV